MKPLTGRQKEILDFVVAFSASNGFPPTRSEIANHFGFASANAAEDHLQALHRKGVIALSLGTSRGIKVIQP